MCSLRHLQRHQSLVLRILSVCLSVHGQVLPARSRHSYARISQEISKLLKMKAEAKDSEVQATSLAFVQMQQDVTFVSVRSKCFKMSLIRPIGETIVK